nr:uncharacterized protein LOC106037634 [Anser cygnoides]
MKLRVWVKVKHPMEECSCAWRFLCDSSIKVRGRRVGRNVICPESSVLRTDGATSERWQKKTALAIAALGESGGPQNTTHLQNDTILDSHHLPRVTLAVILCFCSTWEEGRNEEGASYDGEQLSHEKAGLAEINGEASCLQYHHLSKPFPGNWSKCILPKYHLRDTWRLVGTAYSYVRNALPSSWLSLHVQSLACFSSPQIQVKFKSTLIQGNQCEEIPDLEWTFSNSSRVSVPAQEYAHKELSARAGPESVLLSHTWSWYILKDIKRQMWQRGKIATDCIWQKTSKDKIPYVLCNELLHK